MSGSIAEVATRFKVSKSYVTKARSRRRLRDNTASAQHNYVPSKLNGLEAALAARVHALNDQALKQLCQWLHAEHGVQVSEMAMWKTLARFGLSLDKNIPCRRAGTHGRSAGAWAAGQPGLDLNHLVFLDGT